MNRALTLASALMLSSTAMNSATATTIWTGPDVVITNPASGGVQDVITANVTLTRGESGGIYNAAQETFYDTVSKISPKDTKWAFLGLNGNSSNPADITASNYANLTFFDWADALGGSSSLQGNIVNRPGVVHLVGDDIYLDIMFTNWGGGASGGAFSYVRSSVPEPGSLAMLGLVMLCGTARRRRASRSVQLNRGRAILASHAHD